MNKYIIVFLLFGIGCGIKTESNNRENSDNEKISDWARPGVQGQMSGAYFVYKNNLSTPDTLLSVQSPQAKMTQIHESYTTGDGLAGMREKKEVIIQPNQDLVLKQGGLHVMLMNLRSDLSNEDSVQLSLNFAQAGLVELKLPVLTSN